MAFDEAIEIGCDWLEASGGAAITKQQYANLFDEGFVSFDYKEVEKVFYDWPDYQTVVSTYHEDRVKQREQHETELLQSIDEERSLGLVPEILFRESKSQTSNVDMGGGKKKRVVRQSFSDNEAPADQVLRRYSRYTVAKYLLENRPSEREITDDRLINIALGFSVESGGQLSSFLGSLKNSDAGISELEVERAAEELGFFRYIYADSLKKHQKKILEAGVENHYDTRKKRFVGKAAIIGYLKGEDQPSYVVRQGELLTTDRFEEYGLKRRRRETSKWTRSQCLKYGEQLVRWVELETGRQYLDEEITHRAYVLGLGVGPEHISSPARFGSSSKFYQELGLTNAKMVKRFHELEITDYAVLLAELGNRLGRKPTEADVNLEAKQNNMFPTSHIMLYHGYELREVLAVAGWPNIYSWGLDEHESFGVRFMVANDGKEPTQKSWDFLSKQKKGPSASIIRYKYPGGFGEFKKIVRDRYEAEKEILVPRDGKLPPNVLALKLPQEDDGSVTDNNGVQRSTAQLKLAA